MFSRRFQEARKNALSLLLDRKGSESVDLIDLTVSNPTQVGLSYPGEQILDALAGDSNLCYRPDSAGLLTAREAVAAYYLERGRTVSPDDILLTCSTSEAYGFLFKLLCDPGDAVATPVPSYPLFEFLSTVESVAHYDYPLVYETGCWRLDEGGLLHSLRDGTRAIIAVHPNNPTGHFVKSEEFRTLRTACRERSLALICDEVFWDFSLAAAPKLDPAEETETLTFVLNGVSKLLGLPQLKLGWIVLRGPAALKKEARERLGFIADTFLSVSSPVQNALPRLMELRLPIQEQILRRLENNLKTLHRETVNSAVSVLTLEGGWTAILRLPFVLDDEDWALQLLERHNVVVHPGYFYGIPDSAHLVLSLLPEEAVFREGVRRIVLLSKEVAEA